MLIYILIMISFQNWLKLKENLWGNVPVKGRKPSDGIPGKGNSNSTPSPQGATSSQPKMMKQK
jgi:hypothetical protein